MMKTARFIFVRHGDYDKAGLSLAEKKVAGLNETGAQQAMEMGEWLAAQGLAPDEVITTQAERTKETADWMLMAMSLESTATKAVSGGFALGKSGLDAKLAEWKCKGETVCFVGHCKQQEYCVAKMGGPELKRSDRAVLVYERDDDGEWVCLDEIVF